MIKYQPNQLEPIPFFTEKERAKLHLLASEYSLNELMDNPRVFEDRSIDYAYVSSKIEGSTYSKVGVSSLLKYGWTEGGKPLSDALMVCDLNRAFLFVMNNAQTEDILTETFIKDLHSITTEHQLSKRFLGSVRQDKVRIGGSNYEPLESAVQLNAEFQYLVETAQSIEDPFEQAVYVHCNLSYLQYFTDGNKRTSRLMQTAVMVHHGLTPIFIEEHEIDNYLKAIIAYYEDGDRRSYAELFVRAYQRTIDNLLGRTEEQLQRIKEDEERIKQAQSLRSRRR